MTIGASMRPTLNCSRAVLRSWLGARTTRSKEPLRRSAIRSGFFLGLASGHSLWISCVLNLLPPIGYQPRRVNIQVPYGGLRLTTNSDGPGSRKHTYVRFTCSPPEHLPMSRLHNVIFELDSDTLRAGPECLPLEVPQQNDDPPSKVGSPKELGA